MAIRGHPWPSVAISGHQWPSMAISGHSWPSVAISGHQSSSVAIRGHWWPSVVIACLAPEEDGRDQAHELDRVPHWRPLGESLAALFAPLPARLFAHALLLQHHANLREAIATSEPSRACVRGTRRRPGEAPPRKAVGGLAWMRSMSAAPPEMTKTITPPTSSSSCVPTCNGSEGVRVSVQSTAGRRPVGGRSEAAQRGNHEALAKSLTGGRTRHCRTRHSTSEQTGALGVPLACARGRVRTTCLSRWKREQKVESRYQQLEMPNEITPDCVSMTRTPLGGWRPLVYRNGPRLTPSTTPGTTTGYGVAEAASSVPDSLTCSHPRVRIHADTRP